MLVRHEQLVAPILGAVTDGDVVVGHGP
jgi:hypothetical protein